MFLKCVFKRNRRGRFIQSILYIQGRINGEDQGEGVFSVWFIPGKMEVRGLLL
jgi:hypothetical protein